MTELLSAVAHLTVCVSGALLVVLTLRAPLRWFCGADVAYALWTLVPATAMAGFLAIVISYPDPAPLTAWLRLERLGPNATAYWAYGAVAVFAVMAVLHMVAVHRARRGKLGPVVIGVFAPRVYMPADMHLTYTPDEIAVIRAHERQHLMRNDVLANAVMALGQCLFWFNPLIHIAARFLRDDQEMACDAAVMTEMPERRRRYAKTLLKVQLSRQPLIAGCAWNMHPLEVRIATLARGEAKPHPRVIGAITAAVAAFYLLFSYVVLYASEADGFAPDSVVQMDIRPAH